MPPKENDRLTEEQIELFREWIEKGPRGPMRKRKQTIREEEAKRRVTDEGMIVDTSGGTSEQWTNRRYKPEDLWAFSSGEIEVRTVAGGDFSRSSDRSLRRSEA